MTEGTGEGGRWTSMQRGQSCTHLVLSVRAYPGFNPMGRESHSASSCLLGTWVKPVLGFSSE